MLRLHGSARNFWTLHSINFIFSGNVIQTFYSVLKLKLTINFKILLLVYSIQYRFSIKKLRVLRRIFLEKYLSQGESTLNSVPEIINSHTHWLSQYRWNQKTYTNLQWSFISTVTINLIYMLSDNINTCAMNI